MRDWRTPALATVAIGSIVVMLMLAELLLARSACVAGVQAALR